MLIRGEIPIVPLSAERIVFDSVVLVVASTASVDVIMLRLDA